MLLMKSFPSMQEVQQIRNKETILLWHLKALAPRLLELQFVLVDLESFPRQSVSDIFTPTFVSCL